MRGRAHDERQVCDFLSELRAEKKKQQREKEERDGGVIENKYDLMTKKHIEIVQSLISFFSLYVWSQILGQWYFVLVLLICCFYFSSTSPPPPPTSKTQTQLTEHKHSQKYFNQESNIMSFQPKQENFTAKYVKNIMDEKCQIFNDWLSKHFYKRGSVVWFVSKFDFLLWSGPQTFKFAYMLY